MQFAVTADCHFPVQKMPCFTVRMNIQTKRLSPVKAGRVQAEPRYTVIPPALTDYTGIRPRQSCSNAPV
ncbi:hypothetical protein DPMN_117040 [Dreissena polymorpha]|uniref:Uncharacterized protein n=1 Tax=Dreissena polymorpha TaxID=45954 RepID=A0A9D4KQY1_DREPO|nr:hypothetical protein DPMN_117040 [Dreissena polymorpha]